MSCNIWVIIILLLIVIIIGLISISQYNMRGIDNSLELFNVSDGITDNIEPIADVDTTNTIIENTNTINKLLNKLQSNNPNVKLINYDSNSVYSDMQNSITSNINVISNQLNSLYNSHINVNDTNLSKLENTLLDLENLINNLGMNTLTKKTYNKIKSFNNGMEMQLVSTPNTVFQDYKTGANIAGYMVMANKGCLSVGANDYDIYQCDDKNPKQIFKMEHILNETSYQNNIDSALPVDNTDKSTLNYPFAIMKSINNENCLTNNHGKLTVQPCYSFIAQQWMPI